MQEENYIEGECERVIMKLQEYLQSNQLLMDGAMGTYYMSLVKERTALPEMANITNPGLVKKIHLEYIDAGARLIRTNTFAANQKMLMMNEEDQKKIIKSACEIAKSAVLEAKQLGRTEDVWIAGSIGPIPIQATRNEDEITNEYKRICDIMLECNVDAILFETFGELSSILPVIQYIRKKSDVFIITNFTLNKNGYTQLQISAQRILNEAANVAEINACGFNCGISSGHMQKIVSEVHFPENKYIAILPNASYPEQIKDRLVFFDNSKYFEENMDRIRHCGVHMIGGCCGTTPRYIEELNKKLYTYQVTKSKEVQVTERVCETPVVAKNRLLELFETGKKVVAVELDPPYDANDHKIIECAKHLEDVDIITIADSPMGRSRVDSVLMSIKIANETGHMVMPHISCRDKNMIAMRSTLLGAYIHGIRNCLFVTGDPVPNVSRVDTTAVFDYNSIQLMNFVKEMNQEHFLNDPIVYGGALNHGRGYIERVAQRMQKKVDSGASYFLTQPIYSKEDIERIVKLKQLVDTRILCGIMPLVSYRNANFIKNEMTGINVPDEIVARYSKDMTKEDAEWTGAEIANEIIDALKDVADGYYFMLPFNRVSLMDKIQIK